MASPKKTAKAAKGSGPRTREKEVSQKTLPEQFDYQMVRLLESNFEQNPIPKEVNDEDIDYIFDFDTYFSIDDEGYIYGVSTCSVEKKSKDEKYAGITAKYGFAFSQDGGRLKEINTYDLSKHISQSVVWPMFRSYVSMVKIQARITMPDLPYIVPVNLQKRDYE